MFEYVKTILKKVSFDEDLFTRELEKALRRLEPEDAKQLRLWVSANFKGQFPALKTRLKEVQSNY